MNPVLTPEKIAEMDKFAGVTTPTPTTPAQVTAQSNYDRRKAILNASPTDYLSNVVGGIKSELGQAGEDVSGKGADTLYGATGKGISAVSHVASAAMQPIAQAPVVKQIGEGIGSAIKWAGDKIADFTSPDFQASLARLSPEEYAKATEHLTNLSNLGNIANTILGAKAGETTATKVGEVAPVISEKLATTAKEAVAPVVEKAKGLVTKTPEEAFSQNYDKAFPPLKKDFALGDKRYIDAKTALSDIKENPNPNIVDKNGEIKNPEDYNFSDTLKAQQSRLPEIYKSYTSKLSDVDKQAFNEDITKNVVDKMGELDQKIAKENSVTKRTALMNIKNELGGLRDTSPEGIQDYVQTLNSEIKTAPGTPWTIEQAEKANLAGSLVKTLDDSISKISGPSYAQERGLYGAHKTIQDSLTRAALKELKSAPGVTEKLSDLGVNAEGLNFLITHNPQALVMALGIKVTSNFMRYLSSPQRALGNLMKGL